MRKPSLCVLDGLVLSFWIGGTSADNKSWPVSSSTSTLQNRLPASPPSISSGTVQRITPYGTAPMTPNAPSKYFNPNQGFHTNLVPSPNVNRNPRWNPAGDAAIRNGYENYRRQHGY
jgi:hypothetical protein